MMLTLGILSLSLAVAADADAAGETADLSCVEELPASDRNACPVYVTYDEEGNEVGGSQGR